MVLCELSGSLHFFLWPNSTILAPWYYPMWFQMSKAVGIYPLPVTAMPTTAHSCLLSVPQTCQLWSFIYRNCIYFSQKLGHCTYVMWKENLNHIVSLKTVRKHPQGSSGWTGEQYPATWKEAALQSSATATTGPAGAARTAFIHKMWHGSWLLFYFLRLATRLQSCMQCDTKA